MASPNADTFNLNLTDNNENYNQIHKSRQYCS
jgi:hypothetical protein